MTIDKAIRRLQAYIRWRKPDKDDNFHESVQLGIEALKRCRTLAQESPLWALHPLPGETKD